MNTTLESVIKRAFATTACENLHSSETKKKYTGIGQKPKQKKNLCFDDDLLGEPTYAHVTHTHTHTHTT